MNTYTVSSFIAFILFGMGLIATMLGGINLMENRNSKTGIEMFKVCLCVFFWDFGYAWMSLSYYDECAFWFRAVALLSVTFYMYFILKYVALITEYPKKQLNIFLTVFLIASIIAWTQIIQKSAIAFVVTPWGYWYTSKMSWARILQFASIIAALVQYYVILTYGAKRAAHKRERYILGKFSWFGVILFIGYIFDTLVPTLAHIPAIPGSSISAFFSAMLLFGISRSNKTFGLSRDNVSEYVFQDVTIPVLIADNQNQIVLYNDSAKDYLECSDEQMVLKKLEDFFMEIVLDEPDERSVWETDSNATFARLVDTEKICKLEKTLVKDRFDDLLYTIYFVQDVTKERNMLNMLEESRRNAEAANEAKSAFLANISHEIRTPINAVLGMNEMIIRECEDDNILGYSKDIEGAGRNLLSLVNDILDISKIESGKMELVPVEYSLSSMLNDSFNTVLLRAKEKNLELVIENNEFIPSGLYGDEVRIRQIIMNLLTNAVKYTKEGKVTLRVNYRQTSADMLNLIISVEDTGIGLTPEQKGDLFNNFKRLDQKENRNIEGTGLGLVITKTYVDLMEGEIKVESERGVGSIFTVIIPQKIIKDIPVGKVSNRVETAVEKREVSRDTLIAPDVSVLVVDDVDMNIKVFRGLMKKTQIQVDSCMSGAECLKMIQKKKYDMIFLDHMMPGMDGIETFHAMKDDQSHMNVDTPVIMLTANAIVGAQEEYKKEGLDDYLSKPIAWKALEDMIRHYALQK